MGMISAQQARDAVAVHFLAEAWLRDSVNVQSVETTWGPATTVAFLGSCDHETCHEEHDLALVFKIGEQHFRVKGTWSSQDGTQFESTAVEVSLVEKTIVAWDPVPVKVWDAATISQHIREWMATQRQGYEWPGLFYATGPRHLTDGLEIPGLPWPVRAVEEWIPGEIDCTGPVYLIFEIDGKYYHIKGRNVSHCGWEFENHTNLVPVEKKTITKEVWA